MSIDVFAKSLMFWFCRRRQNSNDSKQSCRKSKAHYQQQRLGWHHIQANLGVWNHGRIWLLDDDPVFKMWRLHQTKQNPLAQRLHTPTLTLVDWMESTVRTRVLTLICYMMVISKVFFLLAMGKLLKQAHTMWMASNAFLLMGSSIKLNWMGLFLTRMLQPWELVQYQW